MPLAYPLPNIQRITDGRETLDLPGVRPVQTQIIKRQGLPRDGDIPEWTASIQLNANAAITWTGGQKGANLMGWAILAAAHALRAEYRLSPEEPGTIYFTMQTAASLVYDLALTAPWLSA